MLNLLRRGRSAQVAAAGPQPPVARKSYRPIQPPARRRWSYLALLAATAVAMAVYGILLSWLPAGFLLVLMAPIAALALVVVWALPNTEQPPLRTLEASFFCYLVALLLWPYYLAVQIPGLPLLEIRRAISAVMVLALLICFSTSQRFRDEISQIMRANKAFMVMYGAFVAIQIASIPLSRHPLEGVQTFIKHQLSWSGVFFPALYVFSRPGRIRIWILLLIGLALMLSLMGYLEFQKQGILWADSIPSFLRVNDPAMVRLLRPVFRDGAYRVVTTFSVSLSLSEFMALLMPLLVHGFLTARSAWVRVLCLVLDMLFFGTILLTGARVGVVGAIAGHALYGLMWSLRLWRTEKAGLIGPAVTLAYPALFALLGVAILSIGRLRIMTLGGGSHVSSNQGRMEQMEQSIPLILRSPLFGYGPRQGSSVLGYTNAAGQGSIDSHFLVVLLDYGFTGFVLYYGMILLMSAQAIRFGSRVRSGELAFMLPVAVILLVWVVSKIVLAQEDSASMIYMMLGLAAAAIHRAKTSPAGGTAEEGVGRLRT